MAKPETQYLGQSGNEVDQLAQRVLADAGGQGAVMFKGWPFKEPDAASDELRLFTDSQFMEWLEIPRTDILHTIPGSTNPSEDMRSVYWVKREATVTKCQSGRAFEFPETEYDPTARTPRFPR